jgi:hypothetical protein
MPSSDPQALLDVWDAGHSQRPERWALTVLGWFEPDVSADAHARRSIGQRDAALLRARMHWFGRSLGVLERCPRCAAMLEVDLDVADLLLPSAAETEQEFALRAEACDVRFRLPNSHDLLAASACPDLDGAQALLVDRCLLGAIMSGAPVAASELPSAVVNAVSERMTELDPQADLRLNLHCVVCRHEWKVVFDILPFLWCELNAWALRMLHEVHRLATAYGWAEPDILALSPARRGRYLAMVGA